MKIAVIGGGPAGLRAAEVAMEGGATVTVFEGKPSVGRKFLVAGKGGLNLTNSEPRQRFVTRYSGPRDAAERWPSLVHDFDAEALQTWASGLGVETFAATTGRVYPRELKAAPLLRRWVQRLRDRGVQFAVNHRWQKLTPGAPITAHFDVHGTPTSATADAVILALGGGSWPETGSDGAWTSIFAEMGVGVAPLQPANCGWEYPWPPEVLAVAEGQALKNIVARAGAHEVAGELLVTRYGLEGGAIYQLGPALRAMEHPMLTIDFKPAFTAAQLVAKLGGAAKDLMRTARERWRLSEASMAVLERAVADSTASAHALAAAVKACPLRLSGPRPIAEAISSAGGVSWSELNDGLMLRRLPGVFVAGEMIDWEAPTGGYLIQGCFATGTRAGNAAVRFAAAQQ